MNGIDGKMYSFISELYKDTRACIQLNDDKSETFNVSLGVRQGDTLSPTLFSLFINDLALQIKELDKGIAIGNVKIDLLLYADDIVCMAENERNLQEMIMVIQEWCEKWRLELNTVKVV